MQQLQVNMLSAEQGLRNASRGEYNFGVASLTSDMRNHFASVVFVASVIKAISAGTRPDQERLLVLEGVADRFPPAAAERQCVFDLQTEIQKLDRGAGGRYVFAKDNVKMAKKGPVTQEVTCKIAVCSDSCSVRTVRHKTSCTLVRLQRSGQLKPVLFLGHSARTSEPEAEGPLEPVLQDCDQRSTCAAQDFTSASNTEWVEQSNLVSQHTSRC